ncbi:glycoside hydrolase family 99-like domain-containing protein [Bacteroides acidifaciens]|uniref:glycosyltransferase WbsX family protein n=1 Tax=Bacteroides acidifaciens TaxID=85831 RepID=UPI002617983A|nr:glycoside hydrolase family 99-like domain-containing protein [Bacteroides acidifaciens]
MKIIPLYLPQFHTFPENDEWWGKGFTEWSNVKSATPLYEGHNQPRIPLNGNYYDLSQLETLKWQCKLAKDYGIYGFCMYHYWFNGHLLMEKPMEMLLSHPEIDIRYCISWANHDWTDAWKASDRPPRVLISHDFDDEQDWVDHFNYMLQFFKDPRYMSENNKPLMVIYIPNLIRKLSKMLDLWTRMAREAGFDGLTYIYQSAASSFDYSWDHTLFDYGVEMNPGYANMAFQQRRSFGLFPRLMKYSREIKRRLGIRRSLVPVSKPKEVGKIDYDAVWQNILRLRPFVDRPKMIPCAFTDWDNTPRHKERGYVYEGVTPEKFKKYFSQLVKNTKEYYDTDMIFVFAWNEWAEGGYLEPDEKNGYAFLEAIRDSIEL